MAKTLMISNEVYSKLNKIKEGYDKKSYSELIKDLLEKKEKKNIGSNLNKFRGILKGDKEYDRIMKEVKKSWAKWTKKYA